MKPIVQCSRSAQLVLGLAVASGVCPAQIPAPQDPPTRILLVGRVGPAQSLPGVVGELALDPAAMTSSIAGDQQLEHLRTRLGDAAGVEDLYYQTLTPGTPPSLSPPRPLVLRLLDEAACRAIADRFVARSGADLAGWGEARVGAGTPFYRPDVDGIAYFEFQVQPEGFVIVATGAHDVPVVSFSHLSPPHSRQLTALAGPAASPLRIFRLSDFAYVAEDATARKVAQLGELPIDPTRPGQVPLASDNASTWGQYRAGYATAFATSLAQKRTSAVLRWQQERESSVGPTDTWVSHLSLAGSTSDQRHYNQFYRAGCVSGCVPTAWAMLFGWTDVRAHANDSRWAGHTDLFRAGGTTNGSRATVAPQQTNGGMNFVPTDVQNLVTFLRLYQGTSCTGSTMPGLAAQIYLTLATHPVFGGAGLVSAHGDWDTWHRHYNTYRDYAIGSIQGGMPCVVGRDSHAMLAWGYTARGLFRGAEEIDRRDEFFLVNMGWGGQMQWIPAGIYNVFSITEGQYLESNYERCRCECSVYFLGSDGYWRAVPRDGKSVKIPVRDGAVRWWCGGTYEWSRFTSDATFVEVSRPNAFPKGLIIVHAMR